MRVGNKVGWEENPKLKCGGVVVAEIWQAVYQPIRTCAILREFCKLHDEVEKNVGRGFLPFVSAWN